MGDRNKDDYRLGAVVLKDIQILKINMMIYFKFINWKNLGIKFENRCFIE